MYVVGTAGHIDHGKSTLVKALTGIDPDRLQEEKERGMTIDLGFAWLRLPSGREVSIVDVPGHERFIRNMLAGVGGIDLALLVVAADEGIMPQTEEHLAILELLRVKRAVVVLTKRDLVDDDWLALVQSDVEERLSRSPLRGAPLVAVSATVGTGLTELVETIDRALNDTPPKPNRGRPRLPIDRVFTISGFGTVVTGTLVDGPIELGQELEVQPGGLKTRARGLQSHKQKTERAMPGSRVAVNLANVAVEELRRGQVLTTPGWLRPTLAVDAHLSVLAQAPPLVHNAPVSFHVGSAEVMARVRLLEADVIEPGGNGWAQLYLAEPIAVTKGDLFVIRSTTATIGGGEIVAAHARRHRRHQSAVIDTLRVLEQGSPEELVLQALGGHFGSELNGIVERSGLTVDQVRTLTRQLEETGAIVQLGDRYVLTGTVERLDRTIDGELAHYHQRYPLRTGMPREELRRRLGLSPRDATALLELLAHRGRIVLEDSVVRLPTHRPGLTPEQERRVQGFLGELAKQPFAPPALDEVSAQHGLDDEILAALVADGRIVRVSESIAFTAEAFAQIRQRVVERLQTQGPLGVAEVRDMLETSRKYALAIMEYLDQQRLTRRVGDARVLR